MAYAKRSANLPGELRPLLSTYPRLCQDAVPSLPIPLPHTHLETERVAMAFDERTSVTERKKSYRRPPCSSRSRSPRHTWLEGLHLILLKGMAVTIQCIARPGARHACDVDVLLSAREAQHCYEILIQRGYEPNRIGPRPQHLPTPSTGVRHRDPSSTSRDLLGHERRVHSGRASRRWVCTKVTDLQGDCFVPSSGFLLAAPCHAGPLKQSAVSHGTGGTRALAVEGVDRRVLRRAQDPVGCYIGLRLWQPAALVGRFFRIAWSAVRLRRQV